MAKKISLYLIFILLFSSMNATSVSNRIDKIMKTRYENNTPGAGIMILKGDSILMEEYYGLADLVTKEPITAQTRFNIASVSKQFTVVGALRLIEQGKISLNTHIAPYFPTYKAPFWNVIQLWHLIDRKSVV